MNGSIEKKDQDKNIERRILCAIKPDGTREEIEVALVREHSLSVYVDGECILKLICTKDLLDELVIGRLCTDGYIKCLDDISEMRFDENAERADVSLKYVQGEDCSEVGKPNGERSDENAVDAVSIGDKIPQWSVGQIFELANTFSKGMPIHSRTQGTHSCLLARGSEVIFSCEDIGRHNTVDKAVGFALKNHVKLSECILFISGRVPVDMMKKVINAGIPVLVSKSVPTADAVSLAKENGITLIVKAYPDQIEICE